MRNIYSKQPWRGPISAKTFGLIHILGQSQRNRDIYVFYLRLKAIRNATNHIKAIRKYRKLPKCDSQYRKLPKCDSQSRKLPKCDSQYRKLPKCDSQYRKPRFA